jgi:membrane protease subunit HflK
MLTKDQNIVDVSVAVQYRISDPQAYLFNVANPSQSLQEATASSLRQVIGNTTLDEVLTTGRATVRQEVVDQLKKVLAPYNSGIEITDVALQPAKAPTEVKAAFDDAIKAQEDEQRYQNQAEAYANDVVPIAQGQAKRLIAEADAYKEQVVLQAQGDIARFNAIYGIYKQAPAVTKQRLYITALENIYSHTNKIFVDTKGNNTLYLPIAEMMAKAGVAASPLPSMAQGNQPMPPLRAVTPVESKSTVPAAAVANQVGASDIPSSVDNPDSYVGRGERP